MKNELNKLVSVIITTHKRKPEIVLRAINSVRNQTYGNIEIIVVDDSPFNYEYRDSVYSEIIALNDERIQIIHNERNVGACASRNTAILKSKGAYIIYVDDDDELTSNCIERRLEGFVRDSIGLVYSDCFVLDEANDSMIRTKQDKYVGMQFDTLILNNYIYAFPIIKRECFETCGLFDINMPAAQDYEMWLRIAEKYEINYVDDALAIVHLHKGERISTNFKKKARGLELISEKYSDYLKCHRHANHIRTIKLAPFYIGNGQIKSGLEALCKGILLEPWDLRMNLSHVKAVFRNMVK